MNNNKNVSLVLSSGNARGFAHIGAIEALEERGYNIVSITGTSIGSLVGGMYATGHLDDFKEWLYGLDMQKVVSMIDPSLSLTHVVKGEKLIQNIRSLVSDRNIEDLPIPYRAVATDINGCEEVVFDSGSLYDAIRASISIPSLFKPVKDGDRLLIDGGAINPLPLNRAVRSQGDLLVGVNVSAANERPTKKARGKKTTFSRWLPGRVVNYIPNINLSGIKSNNYLTILSHTVTVMIAQNTELMIQLTSPDMLLSIPENRLGSFDYTNAQHIAAIGYKEMMRTIDEYEARISEQ